jgi:hypothetical protein
VKQAKDILAMNRVNFKGVVEKDELLKHVARLWRQEKQAQDGKILTFSTNLENLQMRFSQKITKMRPQAHTKIFEELTA